MLHFLVRFCFGPFFFNGVTALHLLSHNSQRAEGCAYFCTSSFIVNRKPHFTIRFQKHSRRADDRIYNLLGKIDFFSLSDLFILLLTVLNQFAVLFVAYMVLNRTPFSKENIVAAWNVDSCPSRKIEPFMLPQIN